jgi:putative ABC transport system permease protein
MHLRESITIALDTLRSHKLRSFLTLLGVIISVCTLVAVVSLVGGVNQYVGDKIAHLGSNTFSVDRFSLDEMTDWDKLLEAQKHNKPIKLEDYEFLRERAHLPVDIAAQVRRNTGELKAGSRVLDDVNVQGATANLINMSTFKVAEGRFLSSTDETHHTPVAFIGADVQREIYGGGDPVDQSLLVDGHEYRVIGVADVQGNAFGHSLDNFVIIPLGTYQKVYGDTESLDVEVQCASPAMIPVTEDEMRMLMRVRRHLKFSDPETFGIIGAEAVMDLWHSITGTIAAVMVGVSSVFLVVGGIVIMNIMLAAVTERTREVGVRKALGARRGDILRQFLVESAVISTTGGVIGIIVAYLFTLAAGWLTPIPFSMPLGAVVVAVVISTAVGLFFGIYPASRAAKLDPIVALRAET